MLLLLLVPRPLDFGPGAEWRPESFCSCVARKLTTAASTRCRRPDVLCRGGPPASARIGDYRRRGRGLQRGGQIRWGIASDGASEARFADPLQPPKRLPRRGQLIRMPLKRTTVSPGGIGILACDMRTEWRGIRCPSRGRTWSWEKRQARMPVPPQAGMPVPPNVLRGTEVSSAKRKWGGRATTPAARRLPRNRPLIPRSPSPANPPPPGLCAGGSGGWLGPTVGGCHRPGIRRAGGTTPSRRRGAPRRGRRGCRQAG
jgi:hypothetical protein